MEDGELVVRMLPDAAQRHGADALTQADSQDDSASASSGGNKKAEALMQDVRSLSGGEKSTSGLILLAAIARLAPYPFQVMDEFDVFQDEASRRKSMEMLLQFAQMPLHDCRHRQYIMVTPHDISSSTNPKTWKKYLEEKFVTIVPMKAPKRGE